MSTDEEKISSLYQQGNNETPPGQLDDAILNAAHDAVNSASLEHKTRDTHAKRPGHKHPKAKSPFSGSWLATVSIAAVLIITVILVPLMEQELQQAPSETTPPITGLDSKLDTSDEKIKLLREGKYEQESVSKLKSETARKEQSQKAKKRSLMKTQERQSDQAAPTATPMATSMPALMSTGKTASNFSKAESDAEEKSIVDNLVEDAAEVETSAVIMTAELWLEKIQRLIDAGNLKLAAQELDEFKKQYPNEEVEQSIIDSLNR